MNIDSIDNTAAASVANKIEVMQAWLNFKTIQVAFIDSDDWADIPCHTVPTWDWERMQYRIKPDCLPKPYENAVQFLEDQKKHGPYIKYKYKHTGWDDDKLTMYLPTMITHKGIHLWTFNFMPYASLLNNDHYDFLWQDGHVCGIEP